MTTIDGYSVATLVLFLLSTIFVIFPVSFHIPPFPSRIKIMLGPTSAPILTICTLWVSQCIGGTQIRDGIIGTDNIKPYNILILFFSLVYMTITLDVTGILKSAALWVSNNGGRNGRKLFLYFYLSITGISMIVGNYPAIVFGTVFIVYYTEATGLMPLPWLISQFAATNTASMVLSVASPTNIVICQGFGINTAAFTAHTIFPFIFCFFACLACLAIQFQKPTQVPKTLQISPSLDPLSVLRDKVSAIVGAVLLMICLAIIIALSFFQLDVWKIALPFAGLKFIFDLIWDHHRYINNDSALAFELQSDETMKPWPLTQPHHADFPYYVPPSTTVTAVETMHEYPPQRLGGLASRFAPIVRPKLLAGHFPTLSAALPRLPFGLILFAFSQFILIEGLAHQGWIDLFAQWLIKATNRKMIPTIWLIGGLGVILSNGAGTNIGATILLTKVVRAADMPHSTFRAAAISLAVASNIGAVNLTLSASLGGLFWDSILKQKGVNTIPQQKFAFWNLLPVLLMTGVGLAVVTAEMVILYRR